MRDDEKTLAGVEIVSIVLRKADTITQVTEKDHSVSPRIQANGYFSHMRLPSTRKIEMETECWQHLP